MQRRFIETRRQLPWASQTPDSTLPAEAHQPVGAVGATSRAARGGATHTETQPPNALITLGRAAVVAICAVMVAFLAVAVPHKAYKVFKARQHAAAAAALHEEL
jgi:hypothetical protein